MSGFATPNNGVSSPSNSSSSSNNAATGGGHNTNNGSGFYSMNNSVNNQLLQKLNFPTTINFLQKEFRKYENEKELWELERGELSTTISHLEAFRKSQEKIQYDLLRRIKMLEFALRTERSKYSTLVDYIKTTESNDGDYKKNLISFCESLVTTAKPVNDIPPSKPASTTSITTSGAKPKSLDLLRDYLKEIDSSDLMSLLVDIPDNIPSSAMNSNLVLPSSDPIKDSPVSTTPTTMEIITTPSTPKSEIQSPVFNNTSTITENESSVQETKPKQEPVSELPTTPTKEHKKKNKHKNSSSDAPEDEDMRKFITQLRQRGYSDKLIEKKIGAKIPDDMLEEVKPWKDEDNTNSKEEGTFFGRKTLSWNTEEIQQQPPTQLPPMPVQQPQLVHHQAISWKPKYTLRHHLDSVRSIAFHPTLNCLISGSEDCTLKVWNVSGLTGTNDAPIQTLRGHTAGVCTVKCGSSHCFSAGLDETIIVWDIPQLDHNPYTNYGFATPFLKTTLKGHTDAVWSLSLNESNQSLLSASSDDSVILWDYERGEIKKTFMLSKIGTPTCVSFLPSDTSKFIASFTNSKVAAFDVETGKSIWISETIDDGKTDALVYQFACHDKLPIIVTAHEDKKIRFYDSSSGKIVSQMVGHKEAVTSVSFDRSGLYFATVGYDSSLRVWDIGSKSCVQELPGHRKKFDESVNGVAYHHSQDLLATCGADSIVKIYTS